MTTGNGIPVLRPNSLAATVEGTTGGLVSIVNRTLETLTADADPSSVARLPACSAELKQAILLQARGQWLDAAVALRDLENTGEPEALWWYAHTLQNNRKMEKSRHYYVPGFHGSIESARAMFTRSAEAGFVPAQAWLAENCGSLGDSNLVSFQWATRAAEAGNRRAMFTLAKVHFYEALPSCSSAEAKHWFASAATLGHQKAQEYLARMYEQEDAYDEAARWYLSAAASAEMAFDGQKSSDSLGVLLHSGKCSSVVPHDPEFWFRQALLGTVFSWEDIPHTFNWLKGKLTEHDAFDGDALKMESWGLDSPIYVANARTLAIRGSAFARNIAALFADDVQEKVQLYSRGVDDGNSQSMCELGTLKLQSALCNADTDDGLRLLRRAANLANSDAQERLAIRLSLGDGVAQSDFEAIYWARQYVIQTNNSLLLHRG